MHTGHRHALYNDSWQNATGYLPLWPEIPEGVFMPKHVVTFCSKLFLCLVFMLTSLGSSVIGQTAITTLNTSTSSATSSTTLVTSPSDASSPVLANTQYNINYGGGNDVFITNYVVGTATYDNFLDPDTLVIRRTDGSRFINIWYSFTSIDTGPTPDEINLVPTKVSDADAIYLAGILNGGYDNILVNDDDLAGATIQAQTERVDIIWYSGITTSEPDSAVFPIIERGGNDNIKIAAITALDANGDPSAYTSLVTISSSDWTGGTVSVGQQMIMRRQTVGQDPIPLLQNGSQSVEGVVVTFDDLGITAGQIVYGFSIFASDVVEPTHTLTDINTFPNDTKSSVSGLDLVAGLAAAVSSDGLLIETVGPGGYKAALSTWLKANEGVTTATEGSNVTAWEDQAVGNHDADDSFGSTSAPVYRSTTSTINFNPTVDFTNSGASLNIANNNDFNTGGPFTNKGINIAFRTDADGSPDDITTRQVLYEQGGNTRGINIYIRAGNLHVTSWNRASDGAGSPWNDSGNVNTISQSVAADTEYIVTLEQDGNSSGTGTLTAYLNGQSMGSISNVGLLYQHTGGIEIGASDGNTRYDDGSNSSANSYFGEISELIYCNEPTSFVTATRNKIESYLAIKYGITLDQSTAYNYVNSNGDVIFNTTNAASIGGYLEYNNDIAGIGRDDDSELLQLKSKSENANSLVTIERTGGISDDDTWLIWGNDGATTAETAAFTMPDTIDMRVSRVWRVAEENEMGLTSVSFDLSEISGHTQGSASDYSLLIAGNSSNADFSSATVVSGGVINGTTITFSNVNLEDGQYFTLGTDFFTCSPGGVETDLALWYRADVGTNTMVNGADVTSWADQSTNGNDASEENGGGTPEEPTFRTNVVNYNPVIRFTDPGGTTFSYLRSSSNPATDDMTLMSVFSTTQNEGSSDFWESPALIGGDEGTVNGATQALGLSSGNLFGKLKSDDNINNNIVSPLTYNDGVFRIASATRVKAASGALNLYVNSENVASNSNSDNNSLNLATAVGIGNSDAAYVDAQFAGDIPEAIVFADDLDSDELNRVETYLAVKYGITRAGADDVGTVSIDERDYRRADGTAIWDYSVQGATYYNDIAGIGRDDRSCFEQKQSSSINSDGIVAMGLGTIAADNASNGNSFANDESFLLWGNDNAATNFAGRTTGVTGVGNVTERMTRIWRVDETTTDVGATSISFDLTGLGYGSTLSDFQLIVSDAAGLTSATLYQAASINSDVVTFSNINLTDGQYFTLGTARDACGPGGVTSNLRIWLKANAGTNTTTNGVDVTSWSDQSGLGNDASASSAPVYNANNHNFNPSIDFTASNSDNMQIADAANLSPDQQALFVIGTMGSSSDSWAPFVMKTASFDWPNGWGLARNNSNESIHYHKDSYSSNNNGADYATQSISYDIPNVHMAYKDATDYYYGLDFGTEDTDVPGSTYQSSNNVVFLGASPSGSGTSNNTTATAFLEGTISEVIMFDDDLTSTERQKISSYLAIKYGITLDQGSATNYLDASGNVIWNATTNSSYNNDIAGIGRDDDGCFAQKQSHSVNSDDILTIGLGSVAADNASNANSFDDNGDYLIWGNDNGTTAQATANTSDLPSSVSERMSRVWRVEDTGTVGNTEIQFDLTGLGYSSSAAAFRLIVSDSPTMASGTLTAGGTFNGSVLSFSGIDLTDGQYFTLATALETCGPGGVNTGISLWLRADQQVFSDAGSTAAVDGDDAQQWNDQGPGAIVASEGDLGGGTPVEPTFETSEINFNPVLRFTDPNSTNSSYIETATISEPGDDFTLISVFQSGQDQGTLNDFVNTPALIGGSETGSTLDYGLGLYQGQVIINTNTTTVFDASTTGTDYNDSRPHMALATRTQSSGAVSIYMEGLLDATGTGSTSTLDGATTLGIGNHSDGDVQAQFGGDIAESIVFSKVLTGEEQSRVESYLALKYGLTVSNNRDGDGSVNENISGSIDEGDYVAGDGGIVWDYANNSTYHNDVFGIARDDVSCFDQTQSKSENSDAMVTFNYASGFTMNDSWLISGNDNAPVEAINNKERPATIKSRLNREWRVEETGTVGSIELTYDLTSITGTPLGDNNLNLVRLMVDDDGDFSNGGTTLIEPASIDGGAKTVTFNVDFTDGQYYTLGSTEIDALPITLIAFDTRTTTDDKVEVSWATAEEINNSFFTIERSRDAVNFETVGFTEGAGNSSAIIDYTFIDEKPLDGVSYYRLKQTDFNGEFDYSEVSRVSLNLEQSSVHQVVPNPVEQGQTFTIEYPVSEAQDVNISMTDASGVSTLNTTFNVKPENGKIEVSTQNISKGLYFIRIIDRNLNSITKKVIVK